MGRCRSCIHSPESITFERKSKFGSSIEMLKGWDNMPVSVWKLGMELCVQLHETKMVSLWKPIQSLFETDKKFVTLLQRRIQKSKWPERNTQEACVLLGEAAPCWTASAKQSPSSSQLWRCSPDLVFSTGSRIAFVWGDMCRRKAANITHNVSSRRGETEETTLES